MMERVFKQQINLDTRGEKINEALFLDGIQTCRTVKASRLIIFNGLLQSY